MRKPGTPTGEEWIAAVWRDRRHELRPILEKMGKANLDKVLRFCFEVSTLAENHPPARPDPKARRRRILRTAKEFREAGDEELAYRVTVGLLVPALWWDIAKRTGPRPPFLFFDRGGGVPLTSPDGVPLTFPDGTPFLSSGGRGRGDRVHDLRKAYFLYVLEANFRRTYNRARWDWIAVLYDITFDVPDATGGEVRKIHERAFGKKSSRSVLASSPLDLGLKR